MQKSELLHQGGFCLWLIWRIPTEDTQRNNQTVVYFSNDPLFFQKRAIRRSILTISHRICAADASNLGENPNCIFLCFPVCYIEKKEGCFV